MLFEEKKPILLLIAGCIFLTRLPFLFAGYGSEEDAWGLILVARNINLSGIYEVSRFPGHPLQEYMLSLLWELPAWFLNLLTALVSTAGVYFFMLTMRRLAFPLHAVITGGIALAFTPVFYMHSTNIMDYTWTLSLVLAALYCCVSNNYLLTGILIGLACGFRITAGAMVIPLALWHFLENRSPKAVLLIGIVTVLTAVFCFIPVWNVYGSGFFIYYEYFPYPPFLKNIYKGTVGSWGLIGFSGVFAGILLSLNNWLKIPLDKRKKRLSVVLLCTITIALYTYSFIKIPQKTAFVLPMVPFVILLFAMLLKKNQLIGVTLSLGLSCFFLGINLDDPIRGSEASRFSYHTSISESPVAFDLLGGIVMADNSKRIQKMKYAETVAGKLEHVNQKTIIIAGWWQNELNYYSLGRKSPLVSYLYYADEKELRDSISTGNTIYYLPEQDFYNDLRFRDDFTNRIAKPFEK